MAAVLRPTAAPNGNGGAPLAKALPLQAPQAPGVVIPIRRNPQTPDDMDGRRLDRVIQRWRAQDDVRLPFERTIEEHIRMLAGQHYWLWSEEAGRFIDITQYMTESEKKWREMPRANLLLFWFQLTLARLTEKPPILAFQPATLDQLDAALAEVMDPIFKTLWFETGMPENHLALMGWVIAGMEGYLKSRIDYAQGAPVEMPPQLMDAVQLAQTPEELDQIQQLAERFQGQRQGKLTVDVLSPLEARGQWGPHPWHKKTWHIQKLYLTPDEVWDRWQVECQPDMYGDLLGGTAGYIQRVLMGAGYYGATDGRDGGTATKLTRGPEKDGYCTVYEQWEAPGPDTPTTDNSPGGRLTCCTATKVLYDAERPYKLKYTSPIRKFGFVMAPGRPGFSSPMESLVPLQRQYNKCWQQILQHRAFSTNPALVFDAASGLDANNLELEPGKKIGIVMRPGVTQPLYFLSPPPLSSDVWRTIDQVEKLMLTLGNIPGSTGEAPTDTASGELVQQLRFNSDRFVGPTAQQGVIEYGRMAEDWAAMLPTCWTTAQEITYAGADNVARVLQVQPEMWDGQIHVRPNVESMLPEGRGEREQRVIQYYQLGAYGPPGTPQATRTLMDLANYAHDDRTLMPGGNTRALGQQNLGKLMMGIPALQILLLPQYDYATLKDVTAEHMRSPEFAKNPPQLIEQFQMYYARLDIMHMQQVVQGAAETSQFQAATMAMQAPNVVAAGMVQQAASPPQEPPAAQAPGSSGA